MGSIKSGIRTSEFWTHIAVVTASGATVLGTVFDHAFIMNHPALSSAVTVAGIMLIGLSQAAYSISRGIAKQGGTEMDQSKLG